MQFPTRQQGDQKEVSAIEMNKMYAQEGRRGGGQENMEDGECCA